MKKVIIAQSQWALSARHYFKHFIDITSFNPHNHPFYGWEKKGLKIKDLHSRSHKNVFWPKWYSRWFSMLLSYIYCLSVSWVSLLLYINLDDIESLESLSLALILLFLLIKTWKTWVPRTVSSDVGQYCIIPLWM